MFLVDFFIFINTCDSIKNKNAIPKYKTAKLTPNRAFSLPSKYFIEPPYPSFMKNATND